MMSVKREIEDVLSNFEALPMHGLPAAGLALTLSLSK